MRNISLLIIPAYNEEENIEEIVLNMYPNDAGKLISLFSSASDRPDGIPYMVGDNKMLTETIKKVACTISLETTINDALKDSMDDLTGL